MKRHIPNIITLSRIPMAVALPFVQSSPAIFWTLYLLCGLSDILDGAVARATGTERLERLVKKEKLERLVQQVQQVLQEKLVQQVQLVLKLNYQIMEIQEMFLLKLWMEQLKNG